MKLKALVAGLAGTLFFLPSLAHAQAQSSGLITLNTSSLFGQGVFYLDFQFLDGEGIGDGNAQISLTQLTLTGATKVNGPVLTGSAIGDATLPGGLTLTDTDSSGVAECVQGFFVSSATSEIRFAYNATATSLDVFSPDQFNFLILQSDKVTPLSTFGPNGVEVVSLIMDSAKPTAQGYGTTPGSGFGLPTPTVTSGSTDPGGSTAAPEPGSGFLAMGGMSLIGFGSSVVRRRRFVKP